MTGYELLKKLKELGYIKEERDPYWWPNSGSFEVVVGAVLTQNTKWENVEKALQNLRTSVGEISLDNLVNIDQSSLACLIKPAGFYNTKAQRLRLLLKNIQKDFLTFEHFQKKVTRQWLLKQKGIGPESADAILNYGCYKDFFVVDAYTAKLMRSLGYEFDSYDALQEYLVDSLLGNLDKIHELYGKELPLSQIYARFHGKIVEFCKEQCRFRDLKKIKKSLS